MQDSNGNQVNGLGYVVGRLLGAAILYLVLSYPVMVLLNYLLAPALLGSLFGGYLTFTKTFILLSVARIIF